MILTSLDLTAEQFAAGTGWAIKPEGACKAEVCVPLPRTTGFDLVATAERLRMALVQDEQTGVWALGPESLGDRALMSATAPDLVLDDLDGNPFALSSLRGQKVVLVSRAPIEAAPSTCPGGRHCARSCTPRGSRSSRSRSS